MIEIIDTQTISDETGEPFCRAVEIVITNGDSYLWNVGGLPLAGDLQAVLDAMEAELWAEASAGGRAVDLYEVTPKRLAKAQTLVILDEINILRQRAGLTLRTAGQIDDAIKAKLKSQ